MTHRRDFLRVLGLTGLTWPSLVACVEQELGAGGDPGDEEWWGEVRDRFLIPPGRIYLNNATLGPSPRVVMTAVEEHGRRVAETLPPGVDWDVLKPALSEFLGGDPSGWVIPRNTTEAMNFVANGLEIGPGDEVLTTDHEHIGGLCPWEMVCARRGASLRVVRLPVPAESADQLFETLADALSQTTRVLTLSHVTFTTGTILPVERLARLCAERGIVFVVDGAHPPGMMALDLDAVGADFYASSPHKWMLAPQGTGLLHLAPRWQTELWPTLASGGWDDLTLGAHRFNHLGTPDESRMAGLLASVEFLASIGMERIEARNRYLAARVRAGLGDIPGVAMASPSDDRIAAPMVSFAIDGIDSLELQAFLAREANVRTRVIGEYEYGWMRISTHLYNMAAEVDRVVELIDRAVREGVGQGRP